MRRSAKRDTVERAIMDSLEARGWQAKQTNQPGFPDLLATKDYTCPECNCVPMVLVEVKSPGGRLTPAQKRWHASWAGKVFVVDDAVQVDI